jgi:hypothetical protein
MSSLLEIDSSITPSDSASISTALHSKKTAPVWAYSRAPIGDEDPVLLYCIHCKLDSVPPPYGTSFCWESDEAYQKAPQVNYSTEDSKQESRSCESADQTALL